MSTSTGALGSLEPARIALRRAVKSLRPTDLELHEGRAFGRFVVHDHPLFAALKEQLEASKER